MKIRKVYRIKIHDHILNWIFLFNPNFPTKTWKALCFKRAQYQMPCLKHHPEHNSMVSWDWQVLNLNWNILFLLKDLMWFSFSLSKLECGVKLIKMKTKKKRMILQIILSCQDFSNSPVVTFLRQNKWYTR